MEKIRTILQNRWVLLFVVLLGLTARMAVATRGYNYDMISWFTVANITSHGGNVYVETDRYNYGPVWFLIIHLLDVLSVHWHDLLRYVIAGFLSLVDLGIFLFLRRRAGALAAILFFLNPVSIIISGYHCQFDNLAVLIGLWSVQLFGDDFEKNIDRRKLGGLLVLGLSLATKHVLFAFPVWLAVKQKGIWQKILVIVIPVAVFLLSFAPYWSAGRQGILDHVFLYHSNPTNFFYEFFVPKLVQECVGSGAIWFALLIVFAFLCRAKSTFESLLIYTGVLVAFSPATYNQYLAIPMALASVFFSVPFCFYTLVTAYHLCADYNGLHLIRYGVYYEIAIIALCFALFWLFWKKQFLELFHAVRREIEIQLGLPR